MDGFRPKPLHKAQRKKRRERPVRSAVCTPTRYGILTGRYCRRSRLKSGVLGCNRPHLIETGRLTVASLLKRNGYATACIGKWHLGLDWKDVDNGANDHAYRALGHTPHMGYRGEKADIFEAGHRVPFIVRWPGVAGGGFRGRAPPARRVFHAEGRGWSGKALWSGG